MLSLSEGLLFVWEPAYLVISWHEPCLPKWKGGGRKISVRNLVVAQKILISRRDSVMGQVNFLKRVQRLFGENRKLYNCSVMN